MRPVFCAICVLIFPLGIFAGGRRLLVADGSSQQIQNSRADADNLSRMRSTAMIQRFAKAGYLVSVPSSTNTYYLHRVPSEYRYCRPWTKLFLERLSRQYRAKFGERLRVTSLVRTVGRQMRLARWNGNAADATGSDRSSHLTGATLDISKHGMSPQGRVWIRNVLYSLRQSGYLYAIEEFQEPVFHVMVYTNYPQYVRHLNRRDHERDTTLASSEEATAAGGGQ